MQAIALGTLWQAALAPFARCFTQPGYRRFAEGVTGLALTDEEHTMSQSVIGLDRTPDWKALESFAEYGAWDRDHLEVVTARALEDAPGRLWHGDKVWAGEDTEVHRSSPAAWGTGNAEAPRDERPRSSSQLPAGRRPHCPGPPVLIKSFDTQRINEEGKADKHDGEEAEGENPAAADNARPPKRLHS